MLTNKQIKLINSLHSKKGRKENDLFLVEGEKSILELVKSDFVIEFFVLNESQVSLADKIGQNCKSSIYFLDAESIQKLSTLVTKEISLISNSRSIHYCPRWHSRSRQFRIYHSDL